MPGRDPARRRSRQDNAPQISARSSICFAFVPFRLNRLAAEVSAALSSEYRERYGLDIPEWRVLATLGFRNEACSAQYIAHCTRTHKSTISRAVTALMTRHSIERVENEDDRREYRLRMTRKGSALYEELIPRLLRKEQDILSCLSAREQKDFAADARQDRAESRSGADRARGGGKRGVLRLVIRGTRLRGRVQIRIGIVRVSRSASEYRDHARGADARST